MKRLADKKLAFAALIAIGLSTTSVLARGPGLQMFDFDAADLNKDGGITAEELKEHREARLREADSNGDGSLSKAELAAMIKIRMTQSLDERAEKMAERMLRRVDDNGDGLMSPDERPADRSSRMFKRADRDGDGKITKAEAETLEKRFRRHRDRR